MAFLIEITENSAYNNRIILADCRDNSEADADIMGYINSAFIQTISVATKLSWQTIDLSTVVRASGDTVVASADIAKRGSSVVSTSDNQYIENYKE